MTTTTLPRLPRFPRTIRTTTTAAAHGIAPAPVSVPAPGTWAAPTPDVLRALEAALVRWSS
ncbi:hypothetical protein ACFYXF_25935 [Streptomyces sp. NPDC002680]|uniref:hypothetical protein n=1 Tax=Streptomyces sp. NPDC002680 TaxID=3364659 RepID=UPI0036AE3B01